MKQSYNVDQAIMYASHVIGLVLFILGVFLVALLTGMDNATRDQILTGGGACALCISFARRVLIAFQQGDL